jgi:WD40 repeat protein
MVTANSFLLHLLDDAFRFAGFFADTIAEHPSLVHQSALPFAPLHSSIYGLFHRDDLPTIFGGYDKQWPASLRVFELMDVRIDSLALSPDGSKIVSCGGSEDNTEAGLRLWDVTTGTEAVPVLRIDGPSAVGFSPDGSKIWSASDKGTILTLDAVTGEVISTLLWKDWRFHQDESANLNRNARMSVHSEALTNAQFVTSQMPESVISQGKEMAVRDMRNSGKANHLSREEWARCSAL